MSFLDRKKPLVEPIAQRRIVDAIRAAEEGTSGEIRVFVESRCAYVNAADRASELFGSLKMYETEQRNAVLIYIAVRDRQFSLWGDEGIYSHSGQGFWEEAAALLQRRMRSGEFAEGLEECVEAIGRALAAAFPPTPGVNRNELPDEIVFGK